MAKALGENVLHVWKTPILEACARTRTLRSSFARESRRINYRHVRSFIASLSVPLCLARRRYRLAMKASQVTTLSLSEVDEKWSQVESMAEESSIWWKEVAGSCALLCCVQRQLGYMAAFHEGSVGTARVVSQAPAVPLALSWEGPGGDEIYGMSFAGTADCTLLEHLLLAQTGLDVKDIKAKVSLLRSFTDISDNPLDWTPGEHGIWYSDGQKAQLVYLPQAVEQICQDEGDAVAAKMLAIIQRRASLEDDEEEEEVEGLNLPDGHVLYRFETTSGMYDINRLPLVQTRRILDDHIRQLLLVKAAGIKQGEDKGRSDSAAPRFAMLNGTKEKPLARAMVVPTEGSYGNFEEVFDKELRQNPPPGLQKVRRIFVLSPVWDCFIDGCGIPEPRCAWYGSIALDIPCLQQLRNSKAFQVLTLWLLFSQEQHFTLVPILVGGLMTEKAEEYVSLLSPYLADPENLFIVGGDVDTLTEQFDWDRLSNLSGGPERFMIEAPKFVNREEQVIPIFSALELFLSILAATPEREEFFLTRYWLEKFVQNLAAERQAGEPDIVAGAGWWEMAASHLSSLEDRMELTSAHNALVVANGGESGLARFKNTETALERLREEVENLTIDRVTIHQTEELAAQAKEQLKAQTAEVQDVFSRWESRFESLCSRVEAESSLRIGETKRRQDSEQLLSSLLGDLGALRKEFNLNTEATTRAAAKSGLIRWGSIRGADAARERASDLEPTFSCVPGAVQAPFTPPRFPVRQQSSPDWSQFQRTKMEEVLYPRFNGFTSPQVSPRLPLGTTFLVLTMFWLSLMSLCPLAFAGFMRTHHMLKVEFRQELRVCNVFASESAFDVVKGAEVLTTKPLKYMQCQTFDKALKAGDNLEFKQGNHTAGVFTVWGLPQHDAILTLIAHKSQDPGQFNQPVSFMSHVFAPSETAQIAVIDTYNGAPANMSIKDSKEPRSFDCCQRADISQLNIAFNFAGAKSLSLAHPQHFSSCLPQWLNAALPVMFSWLTGATTVTCNPDYDSSIQPGKKGMITDPIEDMTPEKFNAPWRLEFKLEGFQIAAEFFLLGIMQYARHGKSFHCLLARKWVQNQPAVTSYETGRECTGTKESGMVVAMHIEVSGIAALLVSFKASVYTKYYEKGDLIEFETGARRAGPFIKGMFENDLKTAGIAFEKVESDQPSPTAPGQLSVIASVSDPDLVSTEALWKKFKASLMEKGSTEQADGSVKTEVSGILSASTFALTSYDKDKDEIVGLDCGADSSCKEGHKRNAKRQDAEQLHLDR
eukprot:g16273.t1